MPDRERQAVRYSEEQATAWLAWPDRHTLFAQTLRQEVGYAITLLVAERPDDADEQPWDPPRFRR